MASSEEVSWASSLASLFQYSGVLGWHDWGYWKTRMYNFEKTLLSFLELLGVLAPGGTHPFHSSIVQIPNRAQYLCRALKKVNMQELYLILINPNLTPHYASELFLLNYWAQFLPGLNSQHHFLCWGLCATLVKVMQWDRHWREGHATPIEPHSLEEGSLERNMRQCISHRHPEIIQSNDFTRASLSLLSYFVVYKN